MPVQMKTAADERIRQMVDEYIQLLFNLISIFIGCFFLHKL